LGLAVNRTRRIVTAMLGYPCSSPGCGNVATWAVLSEVAREGDPDEWGVWNYTGTLACDGHLDGAEDEALAAEKHYRLIAVQASGHRFRISRANDE
jgi:hypothetical protein